MTGLCALAVACSPGTTESENQSNAAELTALPRGWHYKVELDQIRNTINRLATLPNEAENDPARDQTLILGVQQRGNGHVEVFFRGNNNALQCYSTCGVHFRAGNRTGSWVAERGGTDNVILLSYPDEALPTIRAASSLIVEVQSDVGGQHTFNLAGLAWPPNVSSR